MLGLAKEGLPKKMMIVKIEIHARGSKENKPEKIKISQTSVRRTSLLPWYNAQPCIHKGKCLVGFDALPVFNLPERYRTN